MPDLTDRAALRETLPYRPCAGMAVFNTKGEVFIGKRVSEPDDPEEEAWQLPQGGIDKNEEPVDAALRELFEETSIKTISILTAAPDWIYYDLPEEFIGVALKGKYRGQKQRWFAFLFEGDESEINILNPGGGAHEAEFDAWRWERLENLPALIVPFKRDAYLQLAEIFAGVPAQLTG